MEKTTDNLFDLIKNEPEVTLKVLEKDEQDGIHYSGNIYNKKRDKFLITYLAELLEEEKYKKEHSHFWTRKQNKYNKERESTLEKIAEIFIKQQNFNPNLITDRGIPLIETILSTGNVFLADLILKHPDYTEQESTSRIRHFVENNKAEVILNKEKYKKEYTYYMATIIDYFFKKTSTSKKTTKGYTPEYSTELEKYRFHPGKYSPKNLGEIAGMRDAKEKVQEFIIKPWQPKYRRILERNNVEMPNGFMMYGPPGCGKTYIVQAIAGELKLPLYLLNMSQIGSSEGHETEKTIAEVFTFLEDKYKDTDEPSILFMDEMDTLCASRKDTQTDWRRDEINALLSEINNAAQRGIILIGATNLLENLDEAVVRTGRFDKKIEINKPTFKERKEILLKMAEKGEVSRPAKSFVNNLAAMTDGCTCSDLNAMFNTALRRTIFSNRKRVTLDDFKKALEEIKFEQVQKIHVVKGFGTI